MEITPPRHGEQEQLARIHVETWALAYAGLMPERFLDERAIPARIRFWESVLSSTRSDVRVQVAREDSTVLGFGLAGSTREPDGPGLELYALYVHPGAQGRGIGAALLEAVLERQAASLWVAEQSHQARRFYTREGFAADGGIKHDEEFGIDEVRMIRPPG